MTDRAILNGVGRKGMTAIGAEKASWALADKAGGRKQKVSQTHMAEMLGNDPRSELKTKTNVDKLG